jgi:hypothetical protein
VSEKSGRGLCLPSETRNESPVGPRARLSLNAGSGIREGDEEPELDKLGVKPAGRFHFSRLGDDLLVERFEGVSGLRVGGGYVQR